MRKTVKHLCALLALLSVLAVLLLPVTAMAAEANSAVTLKTAIAGTDATITLTGSFTLGEKIAVNRDVTIQGNHTITRADSYTGTLFEVAAGKTLTLDGGLTINGGNNWTFDSVKYEEDLVKAQNISNEYSDVYLKPESGKPNVTAAMIAVKGGTLNLNDVTIQNHLSFRKGYRDSTGYYTEGNGIVLPSANSTINIAGAKIKHCATGGSGLVVDANGAGIRVNVKENTVIDGNYVGSNHGIFRVYYGAVLTMDGGEIRNTTGFNSNGVVVGIYASGSKFIMNGGTISCNSSVVGGNNGRNAAIYLHSNAAMEMTGGTISENRGRARGGIDSSKTTSVLNISGGNIINNVSLAGNTTHDVGGSTNGFNLTGGTYSQDVTKFIPEGKHLYAFDNGDGTWTIKEGTKITYKLNGGTAEGNPEVYPLNESLTLKDPVREGFIFKGWTGANGTVPQKNLTITLNVYEAEFTANWEEELTSAPAGPAEPQPPVSGLPKTGDNSSLMLFVLMMAASLAGMVVLARRRSHT